MKDCRTICTKSLELHTRTNKNLKKCNALDDLFKNTKYASQYPQNHKIHVQEQIKHMKPCFKETKGDYHKPLNKTCIKKKLPKTTNMTQACRKHRNLPFP
jgi:hypothetical protein